MTLADNQSQSLQSSRLVQEDEISWTMLPLERLLEQTDPLMLDDIELLAYCTDLQHEMRWLRTMLHESIHVNAKLTQDLARASRVIESLRRQLRGQAA